jgi:ribonuclease HI
MKEVIITTDGACDPNPGPGGWAAILRCGAHVREISGSEPTTTNNRMELRAIIEGLRTLKQACRVVVRTDSKIAVSWCRGTQFAKERHRLARPEAYALHCEYVQVAQPHTITFEWVKGHAGDPDNERADWLAEQAARGNINGAAVAPIPPLQKVLPPKPTIEVSIAATPGKVRLTRENLHALSGSPSQDGFTRKQIKLLGFPYPPPKGWLSSLIGTEIDQALYEEAKLAISAKRLREKQQSQLRI